jgi:hypothetical protein
MAKAPDSRPAQSSSAPTPRSTPTLSAALAQSEPLVLLLQRMQESKARFAVVWPLLPEPLRSTVRAGPLDHECWTLLVNHSAAAAKLRQSLPTLLAALADGGWPPLLLKVKVLAKG